MQPDVAIHFYADPAVYPPSEDSRLLLETLSVGPGDRVLEVGTGTGFIALHAAKVARVVATDLNPAAVRLARRNALANRIAIDALRCDLMAAIRGPFDVVVFNPPYLEGEPRDAQDLAWQGGERGSEVAIRFLSDLPRILAPGGRAYLLVSDTNREAVARATESFRVRVVGTRPLFFERLTVLELRRR